MTRPPITLTAADKETQHMNDCGMCCWHRIRYKKVEYLSGPPGPTLTYQECLVEPIVVSRLASDPACRHFKDRAAALIDIARERT